MGLVRRQTLVALAAGEITTGEAEAILALLPAEEIDAPVPDASPAAAPGGGAAPAPASEATFDAAPEATAEAEADGASGSGAVLPRAQMQWRSSWLNGRMTFRNEHGSVLCVDRDAYLVYVDGQVAPLARAEFNVLEVLADRHGTAVWIPDLTVQAWRDSRRVGTRSSLREHVRRLRIKLGDDPERPSWIVTVRGVGYRFSGRVLEEEPS